MTKDAREDKILLEPFTGRRMTRPDGTTGSRPGSGIPAPLVAVKVAMNPSRAQTFDLALGLNRHLKHFRYADREPGLVERFAKKVSSESERDVLAYPQAIARMGVPAAETGPGLEEQLRSLMRESTHIHVQLDGMLAAGQARECTVRQKKHVLDVLARGRMFGVRPGNIANWECHEVWTNYRDKATFYFKKKQVDLAKILK